MSKKPTYFQERKSFIYRMIDESFHNDIKWSKEQSVAKYLFDKYPLDFLDKVRPCFKMNSILWFKSKKGLDYLDRKLREFQYNPPKETKILDTGKKVGEDKKITRKTLRQFLNE